MTQQTANAKKHSLNIDNRVRLTATGVERIDFFSGELITAQTADGRLNIKGEGLYIENLNSDTGELLVKGRVIALSYSDGVRPTNVLGRIFK
ncbi:MAG: YabP/YqfC family sporulation protein [Hominenteromicrobium sp.]